MLVPTYQEVAEDLRIVQKALEAVKEQKHPFTCLSLLQIDRLYRDVLLCI